MLCFFFQAEDGIRDLVRSRGLGDVYKRQLVTSLDRRTSVRWENGVRVIRAARLANIASTPLLSLIHI